MLFAITGMFWIFIYVIPGLDANTILNLRAGQTYVYFVLLTIWGLDYAREERRLRAVLDSADALGTAPQHVTINDIAAKPSLFTMIIPPKNTPWSIWNGIFAIGLVAGATLIALQYVRLATAIAK